MFLCVCVGVRRLVLRQSKQIKKKYADLPYNLSLEVDCEAADRNGGHRIKRSEPPYNAGVNLRVSTHATPRPPIAKLNISVQSPALATLQGCMYVRSSADALFLALYLYYR